MKLDFTVHNQNLVLSLEGDYLGFDDEKAKSALMEPVRQHDLRSVKIDASRLGLWDSTLVAVLYELARQSLNRKMTLEYGKIPPNLKRLVELSVMVERNPSLPQQPHFPFLAALGNFGISLWQKIVKGSLFLRHCTESFFRLLSGTVVMRRVDFLFALQDCTYKAVGIVSLVSFMVGLILAFVGAVQLKTFGAQIYVASLVAIGMTRIMGAIMVGIIMAGRTGASYAATIGTMQVNEEIDALKTMGIAITDFLVLPRITALSISLPFLVILADFMGILGGAAVGVLMLDIPAAEYYKYTMNALDMTNFLVGLFHGLVFGIIISVCGCYFGVYCGRNADSVGKATTEAVVSAIVWMIVMTGIITFIFEVLGI